MSNCSCIRGNYNFHFEALDKQTFIYQDLSDWMDDPRYSFPETYEVSITPPGESSSTVLTLDVTNTNKIGQTDLPVIRDGVWCFETTSCGYTYKRSVGIFYAIECCIAKAYATEPTRKHEKIKEVESFLRLAQAAISINNISQATDLYDIAYKKMNKIKNCEC